MRLLAVPLLLLLLPAVTHAQKVNGNRLTYLDESDPYYVSRTFPKLITPQWVGEDGVEAVVILAIDDMREHKKYEAFLRPILRRLQQIDGRAPVSIMTCSIDPKEPHLQTWLKEGLSLEVHTVDHPCPFFKGGSFEKAKNTYDRCVDMLNEVPNNRPVAFRMPCCDSLNTPSPRFWAEIFNQRTAKGNFLSIDTSVFNIFTANDPELPRELVLDEKGQERFRKYVPAGRSFVNTIEDYPYPYVIGRLCWQFPCVTPSDWQAQYLHKPNNPQTVKDWKAALDCTVIKQGVFCLVFHPHGWIKNDQIVELIDHAVSKHGKKVKFLTFREAQERLNKNLLSGQPLRDPKTGEDNGVRMLDLDNDGYLDLVIGGEQAVAQTRLWSPKTRRWIRKDAPPSFGLLQAQWGRFGVFRPDGKASYLYCAYRHCEAHHFDGKQWVPDRELHVGLLRSVEGNLFSSLMRLRDLDGDGRCELIFAADPPFAILSWSPEEKKWKKLPFTLPGFTYPSLPGLHDSGLRFVDLDGDGRDDVILANEHKYCIYLFTDMEKGWSRKVMAGKTGDENTLPMIARKGKNNGFWVHSGSLWWSNEDTPLLKDHVDHRAIKDLLRGQASGGRQPPEKSKTQGADAPRSPVMEPKAQSPEESLRSTKARPGFEVELVASEPLVQSPIAFAWGPDGKLWVVEMGDYPLGVDGKGKPGGRIKFLEDTKGTGKYDKATLFLDNLGYPTGVMPWGKGVLVVCAPDIFYAEDTDGDGKADKKVVLYTGFVEGNPQHRVNSLVWGLDNWIYCANGDSGGKIKSLKTGAVVNISGRDFRIRPDTGEIETQSGQTQYGRNRDDWGNWFGGNNSNPMWHFVLDDHYTRRNPHLPAPDPRVPVSVTPGVARVYPLSKTLPRFNDPFAFNRFTSACSPIVYRDDLFGPDYANNTFVSEPVHNLVHREIMTPKGVTFTSRRADDEKESEFLASSDNWFRPTMIQTGPDGALWVADMYRYVIEHPQWIPKVWQQKLDLRAGHDKGRIYCVYPTGKKPRAIPRLDKLDTAALVAALDSPNGWQRDMAQQLLIRQQDRTAIPLLEKQQEGERPLCRLHALCTLEGMGALKPALVVKALTDKEAGVRRQAVRLAEPLLNKSPDLATALLKRVADTDPQVRRQLACTLGEWDDPRVGEALAQLALKDGRDKFVLAAVMSSVTKKNLEPMLLTVFARSEDGPPPSALVENLLRLANAHGNTKVTAALLARLAIPEKGQYHAGQFATLAGLLDSLEQRNTSLAKLSKEGDAELKASVKLLAGLFASARDIVYSPKASKAVQVQAIRLLGRGLDHQQEDLKTLAHLLTPQTTDDLQTAAASALGKLRDPKVPQVLLSGWKGYSPGLRAQVLDILLGRSEWLPVTLDAVDGKQILPFEIDAARRQRLLDHKSVEVRNRAKKLFASALNPDRQKMVESYRPALKLKGETSRGVLVFKKTCAGCHQLGGIGQEVGPDLGSLADKSGEALLTAILDPNQAVEARYINYTATTKSGLTVAGLLFSETGNSITLVGPDGKKQVILRTDLEELTSSGKSAMPEGLEKDITHQEMADLIAFIRANVPLPKRKVFEGNRPETVRADGDGVLHLLPSNCAIYGKTVILEKQYGNLGYWSSEDDHAVWTVSVPKTGKYAVWLNWACADDSAGNSFVLQAGSERLTGKVQGTGTWDTYRQVRVGEITLTAGSQQLVFRSAGKIVGALIDLRVIKLMPLTPN